MQIPSYMDLHLLIRSYSHLQVTEYRDRDTHDNCSLSMCIQSYNRILHHLNHLICTVHISKLQSHPPSNANLHLLSPSYPFHDHIFCALWNVMLCHAPSYFRPGLHGIFALPGLLSLMPVAKIPNLRNEAFPQLLLTQPHHITRNPVNRFTFNSFLQFRKYLAPLSTKPSHSILISISTEFSNHPYHFHSAIPPHFPQCSALRTRTRS